MFVATVYRQTKNQITFVGSFYWKNLQQNILSCEKKFAQYWGGEFGNWRVLHDEDRQSFKISHLLSATSSFFISTFDVLNGILTGDSVAICFLSWYPISLLCLNMYLRSHNMKRTSHKAKATDAVISIFSSISWWCDG